MAENRLPFAEIRRLFGAPQVQVVNARVWAWRSGSCSHGNMTAAEQLADARLTLGLSLDDISSRTKISVERLSAIERADPAGLPSLVYLKGFVCAYAVEVRLDPEVISDRYISELPEPAALASTETSFDVYIIPATTDALAEFESENDRADEVPPTTSSAGEAFVSPVEPPTRAAEMNPPYAVGPAVVGTTYAPLIPPTKYRKSVPLAPLVLASALAIIGGYLLSANRDRSSPRRAADSDSVPAAGPSRGPHAAASANTATKQPLSVPRTIDADRAPAHPARPARDSGLPRRRTGIHKSPSNAAGRPSAGQRSERAVGQGAVGEPAAPSPASPSAEEPAAITTGVTPENANNVNGAWNVTSQVESAAFAAYKNLMLGFRLELEQRGNRVLGQGHKISENGTALPTRRRTPIKVEGTLEGSRLALNFTEFGARRTSAGRFELYLSEDGSFRGRFRSDAAQSSGITVAARASSSGRN